MRVKWGAPVELPAALQPQAPEYFPDSRVFPATLRKRRDDRVTWSPPINITAQVKDRAWRRCFNGLGNGIQLRDGTLVFAAQFTGADNVSHSCFIASRDAGSAWRISSAAIPGSPLTSASASVELVDGSLLLSMRNEHRAGARAWARWDWQGDLMHGKWSEPWHALPDPTRMASLIRDSYGELIFSNPNHSQRRVALTIRSIRFGDDEAPAASTSRLLLVITYALRRLRFRSIRILAREGSDAIVEASVGQRRSRAIMQGH